MRHRIGLLLGTLAFVSCGAGGASLLQAEEIKDIADVLPGKTLFYAEIKEPGALAKELASLFEGSVLGNVPDSIAKLKALRGQQGGHRRGGEEMAIMGTLLSPEIVRELGRIQGVAFAITGIDKELQGPEFVAIVLTGDSNVPGLIMRGFLTSYGYGVMSSNGTQTTEMRAAFEGVGEEEGVKLYRIVERRTVRTNAGGGEGKPEVRPTGPVMAMMPGALMIGSSARVKEVIQRSNNRLAAASLARSASFNEARKQMTKAGIFTYANIPAVAHLVEQIPAGQEREAITSVVKLVNPKAIESVSDVLTLDKGNLSWLRTARLNPDEKCPVLDILPAKPLPIDLLHFAPKDAMMVAALSNGDGEARWEKFLKLVDDIHQTVHPNGRSPSEDIGQVEAGLGIKIKDLAGKITNLGMAVGGPDRIKDAMKPGGGPPVIVIAQTTDAAAAKSLSLEIIPKIFSAMAGQQDITPVEKEINGQVLYVLQSQRPYSLYYGKQGATLVFGPNSALVAEALNAGAKKEGALTNAMLAAGLKNREAAVAVGAMKPMALMGILLLARGEARPAQPPRAVPAPPAKPADNESPDDKLAPPGEDAPPLPPAKGPAGPDKVIQEFLQLMAKDEPLILTISRKPDQVVLEGNYSGMKLMVPKLTDMLVNMAYQYQMMDVQNLGGPTAIIEKRPTRPSPPKEER